MITSKLHLYRLEDGQRVPYVFELDKDLTIISETRGDPTTQRHPLAPGPSPAVQGTTQVEGIQTRVENGKTIITGVDDITQKAMSFFSDNPICTSEDCKALKAEIDKAIEDAGGDGCVGCKRGAIIRQFLPKVKEVLLAQS